MEAEQEKKPDIKVKSFRISDETAEAFKKVAETLGANQQETMSRLLAAYELQAQQQKTDYAGHKDDIAKFQKYMGVITNLYLRSLEESIYASDTIGAQFESELRSKDSLIEEQAQEIVGLKQSLVKAKDTLATLQNEFDDSQNQIKHLGAQLEEEARIGRKRISDRDDVISLQSKKLIAFEAREQEYEKQLKDMLEQVKESAALRSHNVALEKEVAVLNEQLSSCRSQLAETSDELSSVKGKAADEKEKHAELIKEAAQQARIDEQERNGIQIRILKAEHEAEIARLKAGHMEQLLSLQQNNQQGND